MCYEKYFLLISRWYEGESVNRTQMDIKCITCDIRTWEKSFISRHILHQHWYTCPIALPVRRNPQNKSFLYCCLSHFCTSVSNSSSSVKRLHLVVNRFTRQTLPIVNRKYFCMNILFIGSFCPLKTHNRTLLFGNILLKHSRHFGYWNQPMNMRLCVCYRDCHEAGLCCCLVIHIENMLRPLQLFYFHLCPI
jgi:hypothetical protein